MTVVSSIIGGAVSIMSFFGMAYLMNYLRERKESVKYKVNDPQRVIGKKKLFNWK